MYAIKIICFKLTIMKCFLLGFKKSVIHLHYSNHIKIHFKNNLNWNLSIFFLYYRFCYWIRCKDESFANVCCGHCFHCSGCRRGREHWFV